MLGPQLRLLQLGDVFLKRLSIHHVGVHVGDEDVHGAVVVVVEHADAHGAEGRARKQLAAAADEALPGDVLPVLVVALHVEHVEVRPAVLVEVEGMGVAAPAGVQQADLLGYVGKAVAAQVAVQNAAFGVLRLQVVVERILVPHVVAARSDAIAGIGPDVGEKQVQAPVPVVVEEDRGRRVPYVVEPRPAGDIPEQTAAVVLEQQVAAAHGGNVEVAVAVVVGVRERRRHADAVGHGQPRTFRPVLEAAIPEVAPELVAAQLGGEVDVGQAVAVDIGHRDAVAVIVVHGLVDPARVLHDHGARRRCRSPAGGPGTRNHGTRSGERPLRAVAHAVPGSTTSRECPVESRAATGRRQRRYPGCTPRRAASARGRHAPARRGPRPPTAPLVRRRRPRPTAAT